MIFFTIIHSSHMILMQNLESAEDRREREAQDLELAKEMAEEDDDDMI